MEGAVATQLEVWGGIECSVNRIGDRYHNQLELGGHAARIDDLDRIASLGIRTVRHPFLWDLVAADGEPGHMDLSWCDSRVKRLDELGLQPIAGLVHHGSGPRHTGLLDSAFAPGLASYAEAFARRYPAISLYTPINEPLTTARFSTLYGLWYPHCKSDRAFVLALLNQCRATVLAMQAIRRVNPAAQLVQTEDLGHVSSTPTLAYQAKFENHRRWLTWDLLCGHVDRGHALWNYLRGNGGSARELDWLRRNACPPDVIGINHYVTSNRILDERVDLFPNQYRGGNGRQVYADVDAVRVLPESATAWGDLIDETWQRYRLPIAITEVHIGCTRDEQMRWLYQAWSAAVSARERGCNVVAVTPWALFGSHDWASLLTRFEGLYEPGAWDVRSPTPRRTALAGLIADLAGGRVPPAENWLRMPGWWQRDTRFIWQRDTRSTDPGNNERRIATCASRIARAATKPDALPGIVPVSPMLITGATGTLGRAFARVCELRGLPYKLVSRQDMDICNAHAINAALDAYQPRAVINAAGYVRVDDAEVEREACDRENFLGPRMLAEVCAARGVRLVTFSSDLVFDGRARKPYVEDDSTSPLGAYGLSKARAEQFVMEHHPGALIIRTSAFFGPWDEHNFLTISLRALARGETVRAAHDVTISPTYIPDLVHASLDLFLDGEAGLWHLANRGSTSWLELAREAASRAAAGSVRNLIGVPAISLGWRAPRPPYSVLESIRGPIMPTLDDALARYVRDAEWQHEPLATPRVVRAG